MQDWAEPNHKPEVVLPPASPLVSSAKPYGTFDNQDGDTGNGDTGNEDTGNEGTGSAETGSGETGNKESGGDTTDAATNEADKEDDKSKLIEESKQ